MVIAQRHADSHRAPCHAQGAVAAKYACTFPAKVRTLVLAAAVGTTAVHIPWGMFPLLRLPIIPALLARTLVSTTSLQSKKEWENPDAPGSNWLE
jgi:pimeloyl-ACP methyl ester carboxylesterase|eukprot:COSAG01_NODE_2448_length_7682_cov_10.409600_2_plen_95_part_00